MTNIVILGEAWGEAEEKLRMPFVGVAGYELNGQLEDAGINRRECHVTNVFNLRPQPTNEVKNLCCPKKQDTLGLPPLGTGQYLRAEFAPELDRLYSELASVRPNIIIALGGTALWALSGISGISRHRGALRTSEPLRGEVGAGLKVLPTYHPAAVVRQYALRPTVIADLQKAKRQSEFPEIRRPHRYLHTEPSLVDLESFLADYILPARTLAFDIETAQKQITCIGFAPSADRALVVPFLDTRNGGNYWASSDDERAAWAFVRRVLDLPIPKVAQNGLYDVHWLWRNYGIPVRNFAHDTMLLHHALHPESQKGLGFLGSIYTDAPAWKTEKPKSTRTTKKEDT